MRGPLSLQLRADRNTNGTPRVYSIDVEGRDAAGNTLRTRVSVQVP